MARAFSSDFGSAERAPTLRTARIRRSLATFSDLVHRADDAADPARHRVLQRVGAITEDRATGIVRGTRTGTDVSAAVRTQAEGSVRVQCDASGASAQGPA